MEYTYLFSYEKYDEDLILNSGILPLMKKYGIGIGYATQRKNYNEKLVKIIRFFNENNLFFVIWPLLPDEYGYWISTYNAKYFLKEWQTIIDWLQSNDVIVDGLLVDLEPPIWLMKGIKLSLSGLPSFYRAVIKKLGSIKKVYENGLSYFGEVLDLAHEYNVQVVAPCLDTLFEFEDFFREKIEMFFGSPIFDIKWDMIAPMIYNSMGAGYYKIPIEILRYREYVIAKKIRKIFGDRAGIGIGVIWTGKLGDEPVYTDPEELKRDAEIAKAAGIKNIGVFCLEGVIFRNNDERWFAAVTEAKPIPPKTGFNAVGYGLFRIAMKGFLGGIRIVDAVTNPLT